MTRLSGVRALVLLKTAGVAGGYLLTIWYVYARIGSAYAIAPLPALAMACVLVQSSAILVLMAALIGRLAISDVQERRARQLQPAILEALAAHASGIDRSADLHCWYRDHPAHVARCLADVLPAISGDSRDRLSRVAEALGVVARWRRQSTSRRVKTRRTAVAYLGLLSGGQAVPALLAALDDRVPEIRLNAAFNVLRSGRRRSDAERAFEFAVGAPLLSRAILADALRAHAVALSHHAIPARLASGDRDQILVVLEMLETWGRVLPLPDVPPLLGHPDRDIRARALRVIPLVGGTDDVSADVVRRLRDDDPRVRGAAAFAAGRMMVRSAGRALGDALRDPSPEVALAAGFALAELGPAGIRTLEREIVSPNRAAAVVALEALERVTIGRCDYVRP